MRRLVTALSLLVAACTGPVQQAPLDQLCAETPTHMRCVEAVEAYCEDNPTDSEWCDAGTSNDSSANEGGTADAQPADSGEPNDSGEPSDSGEPQQPDAQTDASDPATCGECAPGETCHPETLRCISMADTVCQNDTECAPQGVCSIADRICIDCRADTDCPGGVCTNNTCVQCTEAKQQECEGDTQYCDPSQGKCVACLVSNQCPSPSAPRCEGGTCGDCISDTDCSSHPGTPACVLGECKPCSSTNTDECSESLPYCGPDSSCVQCTESGQCGPGSPRCDNNSCGDCADSNDCTRFAASPVCGLNGSCVECLPGEESACGDDRVCDTNGNTCVACNVDADCTSADTAKCVDNECVDCDADEQCQNIDEGAELDSCLAGDCVDCRMDPLSPDDPSHNPLENSKRETGCTGNVSCNPASNTCTSTELASAGKCDPCVSDSECTAGHRCVEVFFQGVSQQGRCVLAAPDTGCLAERPFGVALLDRPSASSAELDNYCGISEDITTCEAVLALQRTITGCTTEDTSVCAADGARCETISLTPNSCTYSCGVDSQCPTGISCEGGYCGGTD